MISDRIEAIQRRIAVCMSDHRKIKPLLAELRKLKASQLACETRRVRVKAKHVKGE